MSTCRVESTPLHSSSLVTQSVRRPNLRTRTTRGHSSAACAQHALCICRRVLVYVALLTHIPPNWNEMGTGRCALRDTRMPRHLALLAMIELLDVMMPLRPLLILSFINH